MKAKCFFCNYLASFNPVVFLYWILLSLCTMLVLNYSVTPQSTSCPSLYVSCHWMYSSSFCLFPLNSQRYDFHWMKIFQWGQKTLPALFLCLFNFSVSACVSFLSLKYCRISNIFLQYPCNWTIKFLRIGNTWPIEPASSLALPWNDWHSSTSHNSIAFWCFFFLVQWPYLQMFMNRKVGDWKYNRVLNMGHKKGQIFYLFTEQSVLFCEF